MKYKIGSLLIEDWTLFCRDEVETIYTRFLYNKGLSCGLIQAYTNYLIKPNWRWYVSDSPIRDLFIKIYGDYISPSLKNDIIAKQIIDETLENINRFKAFL